MPENTEEYLRRVTLGELVPHEATIFLAPYDPAWPASYERLARRIRGALGERAIVLEHVGSTSVPGLAAKPVIDIVLAVEDSRDEASYVPALEAQGLRLHIREADWFEHRLFKLADTAANVHVFSRGCDEVHRMLLFRDWLRAHEEDRADYERTKRELAARTWKHVQNYADAKTSKVRAILARATAARLVPPPAA
jgi:GrpB-like predicted nucleotidyltransferase (UPF0157 family)